jgi:hypothetical protein
MIHHWRLYEELDNDKLPNCKTVGFYRGKREGMIILAQTYSDCEAVCGTMEIPLGCIKENGIRKIRLD